MSRASPVMSGPATLAHQPVCSDCHPERSEGPHQRSLWHANTNGVISPARERSFTSFRMTRERAKRCDSTPTPREHVISSEVGDPFAFMNHTSGCE
jgi:hypothetical protein